MTTVDITCDLMDEDETGYVWAFRRSTRPSRITPEAVVMASDEDTPRRLPR